MPLKDVSVIIPAYNAEKFLAGAIESARKTFECTYDRIIVVDDGSTDSTFDIALRAGVVCVRHRANRGISSALNAGICTARTSYVAWLSADDRYTPEARIVYKRIMSRWPAADLYFGGWLVSNESGVELSRQGRLTIGCQKEGLLTYDWLGELAFRCPVNGSTAIFKRSTAIELGLFNPRFRFSQDYEFWLRMAYHRCSAVFSPEILGVRQVHSDQLTNKPGTKRGSQRENREFLRLMMRDGGFERIINVFSIEGDTATTATLHAWAFIHLLKKRSFPWAARMYFSSPQKLNTVSAIIGRAQAATSRRTGKYGSSQS